MKVIYTGQKIDSGKSCFLAGPTPRDKDVKSWRSDAIEIFKELNFTGSLYIPELPEKHYYDNETSTEEIKWDQEALEKCDIVMFWIPRDKDMLGLSTNVEFGFLINKGNIVYGRPNNAMRCEFLDYLYKSKLGKEYNTTLKQTIKGVIDILEKEA